MTDVLRLKAELNKGWSDEIGGRIIFQNNNYKVTAMNQGPKEKTIKFRSVTFLGDETIPSINHEGLLKEYKVGKKMILQWTVKGVKGRGQDLIKYGIVLYNNGPRVVDLNSIFLRCITLPRDKQTSDPKAAAHNMLVSISTDNDDHMNSDLAVIESITDHPQKIKVRMLISDDVVEIEWNHGQPTSAILGNIISIALGSWREAHYFQSKYMAGHPYVLDNRYEY